MTIRAAQLANEILSLATRDAVPVDPMKLQKLVYLTHGWHLAFTGKPLVHESFEAWAYGPVIPSLYREFKDFGSRAIDRFAKLDPITSQIESDSRAIIEEVWKTYKTQNAVQLSTMTHQPGFAWDRARREASLWYSPDIPDASIREEFLQRQKVA
jgi:uncharacterized phage-associated protein